MQVPQNVQAYLNACRAIADAIKELGSVPSGHLYARVMGYMSLDVYDSVINRLIGAGLVRRSNFELFWVEPDQLSLSSP